MTVVKGERPPLACAECKLGHYTLYAPTMNSAPEKIYTRRQGVQVIPAQKTFLREGEPLSQIFTLYSGWAFRFKQLPDGRRQILSFLLPGDMIVMESLCFAGQPAPYSAKSLTELSICIFSLDDMTEVMHASKAQSQYLSMGMRDHLTAMNRRLTDIGCRSALGRVAQLILELESRLRQRGLSVGGAFPFPVRQEHIADALGLTTVYVNRTLDRLRRQGVIAFSRESMAITDMAMLTKIAEEE